MAKNEYKLGVRCLGQALHVASISFHDTKREMFYNIPYDRARVVEVVGDGGEQSKSRMVEHVSFHADGTIHEKARDLRGKPVYGQSQNVRRSLWDCPSERFSPLIVQSVFLHKPEEIAKVFPPLGASEFAHSWELEEGAVAFSLISLVVGSKIPQEFISWKLDFLWDKSSLLVFSLPDIQSEVETGGSEAVSPRLFVGLSPKVLPRNPRPGVEQRKLTTLFGLVSCPPSSLLEDMVLP